MADKKTTRPSPEWFSKNEVVLFLGTPATCFDRDVRPYLSEEHIQRVGTSIYFKGVEVVAIVLRKAVERAVKSGPRSEEDELLAGPNTPALEEWRKHKARIAKVDADERERLSVPISELWPVLLQFGSGVRSGGEQIARMYGNDVADILNEIINDEMAKCRVFLSKDNGADGNESSECDTGGDGAAGGVSDDAEGADDPPVRRGRDRHPHRAFPRAAIPLRKTAV